MTGRGAAVAAAVGVCAALAFAAGRWSGPDAPAPPLACRPSAPDRAMQASGQPAVLLFGNSQLHDADWRFAGRLTVNCARQGMTLRAGLDAVDALPRRAPAAVVIGFGAVEVLRAARRGADVDGAAFARGMGVLLERLRARWPEARIVVATVPPMRAGLLDGAPDGEGVRRAVGTVNVAIAEAVRAVGQGPGTGQGPGQGQGVVLLDTAQGLPVDAGGLDRAMTHDGVHLTPAAHALWGARIEAALPPAAQDRP